MNNSLIKKFGGYKYNKLSKNYGNILIPLLTQLEKLQDLRTRNNPEIGTLNKQIAELAEQNHVMNGLLSKGILPFQAGQSQFRHRKRFPLRLLGMYYYGRMGG